MFRFRVSGETIGGHELQAEKSRATSCNEKLCRRPPHLSAFLPLFEIFIRLNCDVSRRSGNGFVARCHSKAEKEFFVLLSSRPTLLDLPFGLGPDILRHLERKFTRNTVTNSLSIGK